ncbi:MAG TPA: MBL fold metallo-hydrolase [Bacteroidales bacterium]|nr:MBL fold metallo-hydrolase [Bacteroidales bacterium]
MKLHIIDAENYKIDGGACFGVVPKAIWGKNIIADENNMIPISNRLLLIEQKNEKILIDTGIGNKQDEKYFSHFYISGLHVEEALKLNGFSANEITAVILTHLHFDHVGGCLKYNKDHTKIIPVFPNATYYCSHDQWVSANNPNPREKASYHKENFYSLFENGQIEFIHNEEELFENIFLKIYNGHTLGQLIPEINYNGKKIVFMADFIPSLYHLHVPYIPSFDIQPLLSLKEKTLFYERAINENFILFFEHDPENQCCTIQKTDKGIKPKEIFRLNEVF